MMVAYIVVFVCIWWVVFYMALPFSIKTISPSKFGYDSGAPKHPHLEVKAVITTIITTLLTTGLIYLIENGYLTKFIDDYVEWLSMLK